MRIVVKRTHPLDIRKNITENVPADQGLLRTI